MKSLSFTSSSKAWLKASWVTKASIASILLVVALNVWVNKLESDGVLYTSIPRGMLNDALDRLLMADGYWWLGNSTLAAGLNEEIAGYAGDPSVAIVELGSATLPVTVNLAKKALAKTDNPPKRIILFFTKDDVNANGVRAVTSASYHRALEAPSLYEYIGTHIPIYSCRYSIRKALRSAIADTALGFLSAMRPMRPVQARDMDNTPFKRLENSHNSTYLYNLGKDFSLIDIDLAGLSLLAKEKGVDVFLVSPPVTKAVTQWQDRHYPGKSWEMISSKISKDAEAYAISVLDYTHLLQSTTQYFKDAYHLNHLGSEIFTKQLLEDMK